MNLPRLDTLITKLVVFLLGLIFLIPSVYKIYTYCIFRYESVSVYGIIDRPLRARDIGAKPLVEYKDLQGNVYKIRSKAKTHWFFTPKKGEKLKVFYIEHDPKKALVDSIFHYLFLPLFFGSIGAIALLYVFNKSNWKVSNTYRNRHNSSK